MIQIRGKDRNILIETTGIYIEEEKNLTKVDSPDQLTEEEKERV